MAFFRRKKFKNGLREKKRVVTDGQFIKCDNCNTTFWKKDLEENLMVCPQCGYHFKIYSLDRLKMLFDDEKFEEFDEHLYSPDPFNFVDKKAYKDRLKDMEAKTGIKDAVRCAKGKIGGYDAIVVALEYRFIGGSMGSVVGEKITRMVEKSLELKIPLIIVSASGGARMMEGVLSLMQMAKINSALARLDEAGIPFISVLTDPTTGGVTASFAMVGDLNIAEPGALIGFAGPRVIEQTIRQKLPDGFQRSEFLLRHGMLDAIVDRRNLKEYIVRALKFFLTDAKK